MASVDKEFLLSALRSGFSTSQIAESLGVTASAVDQVINAYDLREIAAKNSRFESIDNQINSLEEKVLGRIEKALPSVCDPMKLTRMLQVLNGAKRRSLAEGRTLPNEGARLIQLRLPERVHLSVSFNERNEVIDINGRELVTAAPDKVLKEADNATANQRQSIASLL